MINCLLVGIGGFVGSVLRYLMGMIPFRAGEGFPINTLFINIIGAFAIGIIVAVFAKNAPLDSRLLLMLKVGVCGGFTTFSTFSFETADLIRAGSWGPALLYAILSVILCVLAVFLGQYIVK